MDVDYMYVIKGVCQSNITEKMWKCERMYVYKEKIVRECEHVNSWCNNGFSQSEITYV